MSETRVDSIARNTAFAFAVQVTTSLFTAVLTLYLVRALGPSGYGLFALAVAVGGLLSLPSDFGVSQAVARFAAERRGDRAAVAGIVVDGLKLKLLGSGVVSAALLGAAEPIADLYGKPALAWPLRGIALALLGQSLVFFFGAIFAAVGRTALNLRVVLSESAVEAGASIAIVALGAGATGAAFGRATGYLVGGGVGLVVAVRYLGSSALAARASPSGMARRIASYAGALLVVDAAYTLFDEIDVLLIGAYLGSVQVGLFQAPMRLVIFLHYPGYAVANGVAPRLAAGEGGRRDVDSFARALRYLVLLQVALTVPVLVWANPLVDLLLGGGYERSANVLRALAPFVFLLGLAPLITLGANYLGEARRRIPVALATVAVNLGLDVVLIPSIGIVGGAVGTDVGFVYYLAAHLWICRRALDLTLRPLVVALARAGAAGAAMAGVLALAGTHDLSVAAWIGGAIGATAAYVGVLIILGELSRDELRAAGARLGLAGRRPV